MQERKGARKVSEIPPEVLNLLNSGQIQSVNLTEWLAVDHQLLFQHVVQSLDLEVECQDMLSRWNQHPTETRIMKLIPAFAADWLQFLNKLTIERREEVFQSLATHPSDSVRCWAAYIIGLDPQLELADRLSGIRAFAADAHFGVREISWMAVREAIILQLPQALALLDTWVQNPDANIRRFAIEATRPQGVWAKHITALKNEPALGLHLLEAVRSDPAKYVQDSVGNWLNDAAKSHTDWVQSVCDRWRKQSATKETSRIVTKALRTINKQK
ncbi:DNA alkylation repair protein [Paenibacillus donghaensis]|uniref:DNA alkylation repair protein n=1 Tax=Paenibacillus donghaensis TaxID=414771 RepID=A0A2Z2KHC5_9BACL|nr:DNA alkylation repair protein [Paenibacillus donghaensis]